MADFKVSSEQLRNTASQLGRGAAEIEAKSNELRSQVDNLVSAGWQGAASAQFNSCYQEWHASQQRLRESLNSISVTLNKSAENYEHTEQVNQSNFSG